MMVLVTSLSDFWIEDNAASVIQRAWQDQKPYLAIQGSLIATSSIKGILKPSVYKTHCVNARRNWTCSKGAGHNYNQRCDCNDLLKPKDLSQPSLNSHNERTFEQSAQEKVRAEAMKAWIKHCQPNWGLMKNKREQKKYVDNFIKNY